MREPSNDKIEITEKELYDIIERAVKNDWQTVAEVYEMVLDEHYAKTERELQELLNSEQNHEPE